MFFMEPWMPLKNFMQEKQVRSPSCLNGVSQIKEIFVQVSGSSYFSPE